MQEALSNEREGANRGSNPPAIVEEKRAFAERWHLSLRTVDNFLAAGMPHLKIGRRRVRIDAADGDEWMRERFGTQRHGGSAP